MADDGKIIPFPARPRRRERVGFALQAYGLKGREPYPIRDDDIGVAMTDLPGGVSVSTVFLGVDHDFTGTAPGPILFETMIFGGDLEDLYGYQERCCTWDEAEEQHATAVAFARAAITARGA